MRASITMVLLLLAAATSTAALNNTKGSHAGIMSLDLSQMTYPSRGAATRIWTKADLDHASSVLNYEQMWPVIKRLEAGLPITVLAYGDSITMAHAGCFHRDRYVKTRGQKRADGKASFPYTGIYGASSVSPEINAAHSHVNSPYFSESTSATTSMPYPWPIRGRAMTRRATATSVGSIASCMQSTRHLHTQVWGAPMYIVRG